MRVLGAGYTGSGAVLLGGLRWAVEQGFDVINMSLSTTKSQFARVLHELADSAYFDRTMLVASAHNMPVEELSVALRLGDLRRQPRRGRSARVYYEPDPPVEFFARGVDVEVAWLGGGTLRVTGNSFATPHVRGSARSSSPSIRSSRPFELKTVLRLVSSNVEVAR